MTRAVARLRPPAVGGREPGPGRLSLARMLAVGYVGSIPFDGLPVGGRSLPFFVGLAFAVAALADIFRPQRVDEPPHPVPLAVLAAVLGLTTYATASYFWAIDPAAAAGRVPTLLALAATTVLLAAYLPAVWRQALWSYCLSAGLLGALVLAAPAGRHEYRRTASGNEDDVAALLVLACVIALYLALSSTARTAIVATGLLILSAAGGIATGSRAAVIAGGVGLLLTLSGWLMRSRRDLRRVGLLLLVAVAVALNLPRQFVPPRLGEVGVVVAERDLTGRDHIWTAILERGFDLHGLGLGGTQLYLDAVIGRPNVAHSAPLGVLLELGLLGLLLFGAVGVIAASRGRFSAFRPVLLPLGAAMGLMSLSLTVEWRRCVWLVLAFALAAGSRGGRR